MIFRRRNLWHRRAQVLWTPPGQMDSSQYFNSHCKIGSFKKQSIVPGCYCSALSSLVNWETLQLVQNFSLSFRHCSSVYSCYSIVIIQKGNRNRILSNVFIQHSCIGIQSFCNTFHEIKFGGCMPTTTTTQEDPPSTNASISISCCDSFHGDGSSGNSSAKQGFKLAKRFRSKCRIGRPCM